MLGPTEEEIIRLCLCHTIFINFQSCMLLLIFLLRGLFLLLIQQSRFGLSSSFKEFSLGCLLVGCSLIRKKGKLVKKTTCSHSLSFFITHCTICCYSLSLVVICCHPLSLDMSLICLFIPNDLQANQIKGNQSSLFQTDLWDWKQEFEFFWI